MISGMRIGTWNLDGNWSLAYHASIQKRMCEVWFPAEGLVNGGSQVRLR